MEINSPTVEATQTSIKAKLNKVHTFGFSRDVNWAFPSIFHFTPVHQEFS